MPPNQPEQKAARKKRMIRIALIVGSIILTSIIGIFLQGPLEKIVGGFDALGAWQIPAFMVAVAVVVVVVLPSSPFTLGAGYLLGVVRGSFAILVGMTLGSAIAFLIARFLARDRVIRLAGSNPQLAALDEAVAAEGWKFVFLIRLIPFFPSKIANYVFGVARISFWPYVWASLLGYVPNTISSVYIGSLAHEVSQSRERTPMEWLVWIMGLVALLSISIKASRMARRVYAARGGGPAAQA